MTRPTILTAFVTALAFAIGLSGPAFAADDLIRFPSLVKPSKYEGTDAKHYDYVNPDAPVGGRLNQTTSVRFDSFNPFVVSGTPATGLNYAGGLLYDTLMDQSLQEPGTSYPMIALGLTHPDDYSSATYTLDPSAKWHDGRSITAEDVVWSLAQLKENQPLFNRYFADVTEAIAEAPDRVRFVFSKGGNRELPHIMGDLPVLPKHWWTANGPDGKPRDISKPTLEMPLGSGPYRIKAFKPGSSVTWERVEDYWGWDTFARKGRYNFAEVHYTYFGNQDAEWQAFQKYGFEDFRAENRPEKWAKGYTFPAFKDGDVIKGEFEDGAGFPMQGWIFNTRREKFRDARVREAISQAFDFESMNRTLFFGLYERTDSYFGGSELASSGVPEGQELEILKAVAKDAPEGSIPSAVFDTPFALAAYPDRGALRKNLRTALTLFQEAGYTSKGGRLTGPDGKQLSIEFLLNDPRFEKRIAQYGANLRRLGIDVSVRSVDTSQYLERINNFDYDIITAVQAQSQSPGNEQREYWSSNAADRPGSRNYAGIKNPAIDALVERIVFARDRAELVATTNALDRVLLHSHFSVPQFRNPKNWIAYWDKFGQPEKQPDYVGVDTFSWWIEPEKAKALEAKYGLR